LRKAYTAFVGKPLEELPLGDRRGQEICGAAFRYNNEEADCENVRWVELVQNRDHCPALILTALNLRVLLAECLLVTAITMQLHYLPAVYRRA
jgi:hypothetical protein